MPSQQVAIYARLSHAEEQIGDKIERQIAELVEHAARLGLPTPVIYSDTGKSGASERQRPGWQALLRALERGEVKVLIVKNLSRMHRNTRAALEFADRWLLPRRIKLISLGGEPLDLSTAAGKAVYTYLAQGHQTHRDLTSDNMRRHWSAKRARGERTSGSLPYGWDVSADGKLVPDLDEQRGLARMEELRRRGCGYRTIARLLQAEGYLTSTGLAWWQPQIIRNILIAAEAAERRREESEDY